MSSSPHVVPARFRFGRDPESELAQPPVVHADELMLRRWYRLHDRGRTLARAELELLVEDMAAHPELWRHLLHPLAGRAPLRADAGRTRTSRSG